MCQFFSCVSDGQGKIYYFDQKLREKCNKRELDYTPDSHTSIADYYGFKGASEDKLNKWEYDPITKKLVCDTKNTTNDYDLVLKQCKKLNFKKIKPVDEYKQKETKKYHGLKIGDYVKVIDLKHGHRFNIGAIIKVKGISRNNFRGSDGTDFWYLEIDEVKKLNWFKQIRLKIKD